MNILDRARIGGATLSYDFWLDFAGVSGRRRRGLRRELRANLGDATALVGSRNAVRGLGSTRDMAAAANAPDHRRPRWTVGLSVGICLGSLTLIAELLAALSWLDGAMATAPENRVSGALTFIPGSNLSYSPTSSGSGSGFSLEVGFGWPWLIVGVIAFVIAAQPWRVLLRPTTSRPR